MLESSGGAAARRRSRRDGHEIRPRGGEIPVASGQGEAGPRVADLERSGVAWAAGDESTAYVFVLAIVQDEDAPGLVEALVQARFAVTRLATAGRFLRASNATAFTAIPRAELGTVLAVIQQTCHRRTKFIVPFADDYVGGYVGEPIEVEIGGAVVFVCPIERLVTLRASPS